MDPNEALNILIFSILFIKLAYTNQGKYECVPHTFATNAFSSRTKRRGSAMRYQNNRLQQLRGFYYAAKSLSISGAAKELSLSQPAVSLQIQALERELGSSLFERRGPKIRLTPDGEILLDLARTLVEGADRLEDDFAARKDGVDRGMLMIAAGGSTLQYILPPYVKSFLHTHPQVDIQLHNVTGKRGLALLRAGEVDFAVGPMLDAPPDILFRPLMSHEPVLITARDHPLAKRKRITLKDVANHPLILPPRDQSTHRVVALVFAEHSLQHNVKLEIGGYDVIKTYVRLGLGISIVMSHCLTKDDQLHTVSLKRWFPKRTYGLVLSKGRKLSRTAQGFVELALNMSRR